MAARRGGEAALVRGVQAPAPGGAGDRRSPGFWQQSWCAFAPLLLPERGDRAAARAALSAAVELRPDDAEARFGLGTAQWWLGEVPEAVGHWEHTYGECIRAGDRVQALGTAISLSLRCGRAVRCRGALRATQR